MRVSFRWPRGALATKLDHTRVGYVARVPAGHQGGHGLGDGLRPRRPALERRARSRVTAPPKVGGGPVVRAGRAPGGLQGQRHVDLGGRPLRGRRPRRDRRPRPRRRHVDRVRQELRRRARAAGRSSTPTFVQALKAQGLQRRAPGSSSTATTPPARPRLGADAVAAGADCLVIDAESQYEGKYAAAQQYVAALRAAVGPAYPIGLTSFPYVDYHPRLPYSVFLGPGGAQANLPQVYWKDIGGTVDAVSARTLANNRIYGDADRAARPDLRQPGRPRTSPASARCGRPTAAPGCRGGPGRRPARPSGACSPSRCSRSRRRRPTRAGRRWPRATRATRSSGCSSTSRPSTRR